MKCRLCGGATKVTNTWRRDGVIIRRRECRVCVDEVFKTIQKQTAEKRIRVRRKQIA